MIDEKIFPKLAENVIKAIDVKDGDAVFISGGSHEQKFLEEIGIAVARRGGQPVHQRGIQRLPEAHAGDLQRGSA